MVKNQLLSMHEDKGLATVIAFIGMHKSAGEALITLEFVRRIQTCLKMACHNLHIV